MLTIIILFLYFINFTSFILFFCKDAALFGLIHAVNRVVEICFFISDIKKKNCEESLS